MLGLWGPYPGLSQRLEELGKLIDEMAAQAASKFPGQGLDIAALPEFAVNGMSRPAHCRDMAQVLQGPVLDAMAAKARQHNCYVTVPLYMVEDRAADHYSNVVALLDREGQLMGLYHFMYPSAQEVAFGLTPGREFPVFDCDFGRIGIQICGDVHHEEGWRALADQGAELVVHISQPPTPMTVAVRAATGGYFVLTSTWRGSAAVFAPTGHTVAELRREDRVLVERIDLDYVMLGWQRSLEEGRVFDERFGSKAGYRYWPDEDCGIFWSNDPDLSVAEMVRELGLTTLEDAAREDLAARQAARRRIGPSPP